MIEIFGENVFNKVSIAHAICITTNCSINDMGENPMGGGCAGAAAKVWPDLPIIYGQRLTHSPNIPTILGYVGLNGDFSEFLGAQAYPLDFTAIVAFPTMKSVLEKADINLIARSAYLLMELVENKMWQSVYLPAPGIGIGGLSWLEEVKPVLSKIFDERVTVMRI